MTMYAVQSIVAAEKQYSTAQGGYACSLSALADGNKTPDHKIYLFDRQLMTGKKNGYLFAISNCDSSHYKVAAEPEVPNSGQRAFCSDESGSIRASADGKGTTCLSSGETVRGTDTATGIGVAMPMESTQQSVVQSSQPHASSPPLRASMPQRVRVSSGVTQSLLLSKVQPVYPAEAKASRLQGSVVMHAIIGKDGNIQSADVISSPSPLLSQAAIDAVKQWRYRPYLLNGTPVEVDTQITVNFTLEPQ